MRLKVSRKIFDRIYDIQRIFIDNDGDKVFVVLIEKYTYCINKNSRLYGRRYKDSEHKVKHYNFLKSAAFTESNLNLYVLED